MAALPIADWQAALTDMDCELESALTRLDRYQAVWSTLLDAAAKRSLHVTPPPAGQDWAKWSATATELAAATARELDEREVAVQRWQESFNRWRALLDTGLVASNLRQV